MKGLVNIRSLPKTFSPCAVNRKCGGRIAQESNRGEAVAILQEERSDVTIQAIDIAFEIAPVAMVLVRQDGRIALANAPLCELFGYEPQELVGQPVERLIAPNMRGAHKVLRDAFLIRSAKRKMNDGREVLGWSADGVPRPLDVSLEPIEVSGQKMTIATVLDMRARNAHRMRERRIMDAASCTMLVIDADGQINYVNEAVTGLLGFQKAELIGQEIEILVPERQRRAHRVFRRSFFTSPERLTIPPGRVVDVLHKSGRVVPAEVDLNLIDEDGTRSAVATIVDLSERIATERTLTRRTRELEQVNVHLAEFARSLSHDLKAPLSSIAGLMDLCQEDLTSGDLEEVRTNLAKTAAITQQSLENIGEVLKLAMPLDDDVPYEPVDLGALAKEVWTDLSGLRKDARLVVAADLPVPVKTERDTVRRVFDSLLSNALQFRAEDRPLVVCVTIRPDVCGVHVSVADNGCGMPSAFVPQVFKLFKRYGSQAGTGIGLHLAQRNVALLGGELTCSSKEGKGTRFEFSLPDRARAGP